MTMTIARTDTRIARLTDAIYLDHLGYDEGADTIHALIPAIDWDAVLAVTVGPVLHRDRTDAEQTAEDVAELLALQESVARWADGMSATDWLFTYADGGHSTAKADTLAAEARGEAERIAKRILAHADANDAPTTRWVAVDPFGLRITITRSQWTNEYADGGAYTLLAVAL